MNELSFEEILVCDHHFMDDSGFGLAEKCWNCGNITYSFCCEADVRSYEFLGTVKVADGYGKLPLFDWLYFKVSWKAWKTYCILIDRVARKPELMRMIEFFGMWPKHGKLGNWDEWTKPIARIYRFISRRKMYADDYRQKYRCMKCSHIHWLEDPRDLIISFEVGDSPK